MSPHAFPKGYVCSSAQAWSSTFLFYKNLTNFSDNFNKNILIFYIDNISEILITCCMPSVLNPSILIALTNTKTTAAHTHGFKKENLLCTEWHKIYF